MGPQRVRHDRATEHTHTHTQGDDGDRDTDAETEKQALVSQRDMAGVQMTQEKGTDAGAQRRPSPFAAAPCGASLSCFA